MSIYNTKLSIYWAEGKGQIKVSVNMLKLRGVGGHHCHSAAVVNKTIETSIDDGYLDWY